MQVYIELALIENFCIDFTLLACTKIICRNISSYFRIIISAILGAGFAVLFPLISFGKILSIVIKLLAGVLMCLIGGWTGKIKSILVYILCFFVLCALLGGTLIFLFTLSGIEYESGYGYILSSVPIGIPMLFAFILFLVCKKLVKRLKNVSCKFVTCHICAGEFSTDVKGFFDSGNNVYYFGQPISIIPPAVAYKIIDKSRIKDSVKIHTVAGSRKIDVFTCDSLEIKNGDKITVYKGVRLGIGGDELQQAILHPDLLEE
jgi:stage II sporulation protein GA (sporulation sigma-E factor processing peptidase)